IRLWQGAETPRPRRAGEARPARFRARAGLRHMRTIRQPGPASPERVQWAQARGQRLTLELKPGQMLLDAISEAFAAQGFGSGVLRLPAGLALSPFAYVMPALSQTSEHAAFYSETFRPEGVARIETGAL